MQTQTNEHAALALAAWLASPFWAAVAVTHIAQVAAETYQSTFYAVYRGGETPWS